LGKLLRYRQQTIVEENIVASFMHFSLRSSNQQDLKNKFGEQHCYFAASQMAKGTPSAVNNTNAGM